jgi:hypothetical protein
MTGLHHFFRKCLKNVGQDSVSGIVHNLCFSISTTIWYTAAKIKYIRIPQDA